MTTASLRDEVNTFLGKELATHLSAIKSLDPPPDRILGVPTTGEFSWGTFMRVRSLRTQRRPGIASSPDAIWRSGWARSV